MENTRNIKFIVVHCTATPPSATIESIQNYWKEVRKWKDIPGYHYLIKRNGDVQQLLDENKVSYGAYGHNAESIHVSYIGGIDKNNQPIDNRSEAQKEAMFDLLMELLEKYPTAKPLGHRDFPGVQKACPCFDVKQWLSNYIPNLPQAA